MQCSFNTDAEALTFLNRHVAQCEKQCEDKMDIMDHDARCYAVFPNEAQNDNYEVWLQKYPPSNPVQHPDFEAQAAIAMVAVVEALSVIGILSDHSFASVGFFCLTGLLGLWAWERIERAL